MSASWFVYIIRCSDDTLYTGVTTDVARRETEHNHPNQGAKYTRVRQPVLVVYSESCLDRGAAQKREATIKKLSRKKKLFLIQNRMH